MIKRIFNGSIKPLGVDISEKSKFFYKKNKKSTVFPVLPMKINFLFYFVDEQPISTETADDNNWDTADYSQKMKSEMWDRLKRISFLLFVFIQVISGANLTCRSTTSFDERENHFQVWMIEKQKPTPEITPKEIQMFRCSSLKFISQSICLLSFQVLKRRTVVKSEKVSDRDKNNGRETFFNFFLPFSFLLLVVSNW